MSLQTSDKIKDLNKWVLQAFEDSVLDDILNNARKAGEALCKAVILHHYNEIKGSKIILGQEKINGTALRSERQLDFSGLIDVVVHEQDENYIIVKPKSVRNKIKNYLQTIRVHGNPASHDINNPNDSSNLADVKFTKFALVQLISWFYKDFITKPIPPRLLQYIGDIESNYIDTEKETSLYEDVRGLDIVKIQYPKQKVVLQAKVNDPQKKISYEFVTVEVTNNLVIGYAFVKKNISISITLQHFIDELTLNLANLTICSPRVISPDTGREINRISSIQDKFKEVANDSLLEITNFFYIDDFVWQYCLSEYAKLLDLNLENEQYFVDQELFQLHNNQPIVLKPSLQYIEQIINSPEKQEPVNIVVGRAGVGKTTFCEQVVSLVNGIDKKRALLISSTDLRNANADFTVKSLTDLYRLFIKVNEIDSTEALEYNNFEINISCGNLVLIIDGLDEIESILKEKFDLDDFLKSAISLNEAYKSCSIIITSRDYHLDRYIQKDSVSIFFLLGFSNELVDKYLAKRLSRQRVKDAQKYLSIFDIADQSLHTPLYLSLICDLVDRDEYDEDALPDISESIYYYSKSKLDNLIYKLLQREIGKQSLEINCDDYFELIVEISIRHQGEISKKDLNEYITIFFPSIEPTSNIESDKYTQFYISPLLSYDRNRDTFKIKYDFVDLWAKVRFVLSNFEREVLDGDLKRLLIEIYDGSSVLLEELIEMKGIAQMDYIKHGGNILQKLIKDCQESGNKPILARKAISGLLYLVLSDQNRKTKSSYSNELVQLFRSNKLNCLSIFGQFFPLDFREVQVYEGWFEQFHNFEKCEFPSDCTVFYYSTFKGIDPKFSATLNSLLFDSTCSLNEELRRAFDDSLSSAGNLSSQVRTNLYRILKVGYRSGSFSWKSESIYRMAPVKGHVSLEEYLRFLTLEGILEKRSERAGSGDGFIVATNFKDAAKNLIANNIVKPELETVIKKILRDFHGL
ncbi:MAG: hypothetical protein B0A82_05755 [Alkalinema sp. CACIAM 70d]|nr:MAG: hypothetical protein B0A82_05755 [Alkalinema sp. CACIAM 70d]